MKKENSCIAESCSPSESKSGNPNPNWPSTTGNPSGGGRGNGK